LLKCWKCLWALNGSVVDIYIQAELRRVLPVCETQPVRRLPTRFSVLKQGRQQRLVDSAATVTAVFGAYGMWFASVIDAHRCSLMIIRTGVLE
jgi:hypothetical protein